ncbi:alpha/beta fold hydrolase [Parahaliea sp. F7430]|uniref:Alpha/beta fold hydrolase n=1 Tax=Sediminihaliea albiluteola TaxID=2758564 RepID=A0A7W2TWC5_9GAMM|nr:alpha/beta fold hydrolase [Sediminihaliea albiluteola]MBA6413126.1 alpha/beta fold hydrolase [Sediminihaliea albiluteola]
MQLPDTGTILELSQGKIHYYDVGQGDVILFLHGSGPGVTARANFERNLPAFAEHFRCLVVDFPGYGQSEAIDGDPVSVCVSAVVELLNELAIERVHIIGNSMGGMVGSVIAANHPERVNRFVTIGGIGMNLFSAFPADGLSLLTEFVENPTRERIESWLRSMVFDQSLLTKELVDERFARATEAKTFESTKRIYSRESIQKIAEFRRGAAAADVIAHLPRIQAPTLLTWGRDDRVTPLDMCLIPMRIIPNCELHVFPNCGHWSMIEKKDEFESLVLSFLRRA